MDRGRGIRPRLITSEDMPVDSIWPKASDQAWPTTETSRWKLRSGFVPIYVPFLFLIPALLLLIAFRYIPAVSAIYHSFTYWNIPEPGEFIGLQNYQALFDDPIFIKSLGNILKYMVGRTALVLVMAFHRRGVGL